MINPIEHSRTREEAQKYKVEPYVIVADIYGQGNLSGRGGWTWYTGSASWMYIAGIKYILGLNIANGYLSIEPHIPNSLTEYEIRYKTSGNIYNIKVINQNYANKICTNEIEKMTCNGDVVENKRIKIVPNTGIYNIEIEI